MNMPSSYVRLERLINFGYIIFLAFLQRIGELLITLLLFSVGKFGSHAGFANDHGGDYQIKGDCGFPRFGVAVSLAGH